MARMLLLLIPAALHVLVDRILEASKKEFA